jgi:hypothetical protein
MESILRKNSLKIGLMNIKQLLLYIFYSGFRVAGQQLNINYEDD